MSLSLPTYCTVQCTNSPVLLCLEITTQTHKNKQKVGHRHVQINGDLVQYHRVTTEELNPVIVEPLYFEVLRDMTSSSNTYRGSETTEIAPSEGQMEGNQLDFEILGISN